MILADAVQRLDRILSPAAPANGLGLRFHLLGISCNIGGTPTTPPLRAAVRRATLDTAHAAGVIRLLVLIPDRVFGERLVAQRPEAARPSGADLRPDPRTGPTASHSPTSLPTGFPQDPAGGDRAPARRALPSKDLTPCRSTPPRSRPPTR